MLLEDMKPWAQDLREPREQNEPAERAVKPAAVRAIAGTICSRCDEPVLAGDWQIFGNHAECES